MQTTLLSTAFLLGTATLGAQAKTAAIAGPVYRLEFLHADCY